MGWFNYLRLGICFLSMYLFLRANQFGLQLLQASEKLHSQLLWRHRLPRQYSMLQPLKVSCYKSFTDQGQLDLTRKAKRGACKKKERLSVNIMFCHTPLSVTFSSSVPKRPASENLGNMQTSTARIAQWHPFPCTAPRQ